ncbi:unnamed protein product [Calypogeia fissa]
MEMEDVENIISAPAGKLPNQGAKGKAGAAKAAKSSANAAASQPLQQIANQNVIGGTQGKSIEMIYQKKTQLEHILLRPDTYVGSIEKHTQLLWVYENENLVHRNVSYVPGLYKIFDEILVNAADNKQRDPTMDSVKVDIDVGKNTISVFNNGAGVPVEIHAVEGVYVPEMIFGHLLTSSNYDDSEKKTTGGRNGFGAKLANIFSTKFIIETADGNRLKRYKQEFTDNMSKKTEPEIVKCKANENWTKVTFSPDLAKFRMSHLEDDVVALMSKRVMDIAGCLGKTVKVDLNGKRLPIKSFVDYVALYLASASKSGREEPLPRLYEKVNDRWEVCVSLSDGQFQQVSFVNSIATIRGGTHVLCVADQVVNHVMGIVKKKDKNASVKQFQIRNHLWIFVNSLIDNPAFDSQTKETLTSRQSSFGSKCELSPEFLKKVAKCGVVEKILSFAEFKQSMDLKKTDGTKRQRITGLTKLDDANDAGGRNSQDCTLILTEGDSAKALAMAGISVVGRNKYGCFPLRGKLLNVREASHQQVLDNAEITNIKRILGLQQGKDYNDTRSLRYGHLMIMTDQDHDGSHIKGLLINFIHSFWPSLLKIPSFLLEFITPIVKATHKRGQVLSFYSMPEYVAWKESIQGRGKEWSIKYYKGLGTSSSKEGKEYFSDLSRHKKDFIWGSENDGDAIEMAFSKKKVDDRKTWLRQYKVGTFLDQTAQVINYTDFVNKELIQFSVADLARSIPSVVDGLKPGQRKILFCSFKRNFVKQAKVSQFAGYVSEHSAYHHGDQSLQTTIIGMAQNFVGSNNINLFAPLGQFGTRNQGGKDHASSRYVFTCLSPITRLLFPQADDMLLDYLDEDGLTIEPTWYAPIIPMVLVNGSEGIGTGWSTFVPNYNPRDIVENVNRLLRDEPMQPMEPWYKGFKGTIERTATKESGLTYTVTGIIDQLNETTLKVTELPVRKWTQDYKEYLEDLMLGTGKIKEPFIKDYREHGTDTLVDFEMQLSEENMALALIEGLTKKFKLTTNLSTSNMHLFDESGTIKKYDTPEMILEEFYHIRLELYVKRKAVQLANLELDLLKLDNKVRFILGVVKGEIIVSNRKRVELLNELKAKKFTPFPKNSKKDEPPVAGAELSEENEASPEQEEPTNDTVRTGDYEYLLALAIGTLTFEKVEQLLQQKANLENDVEELRRASPKDLWARDLDAFLVQLDAQDLEEQKDEAHERKQMAREGTQMMKRANPTKRAPVKKTATTISAANSQTSTITATTTEASVTTTTKKVAKKAPATKKGAAKKPPLAPVQPVPSEDEDDDIGLDQSLSQRMAAMGLRGKSQSPDNGGPATAEVMDLSDPEDWGETTRGAAALKKKEPVKRAPRARKTTAIVNSDSEEDYASPGGDASSEEEAAPTQRKGAKSGPSRKKAPAKSSVPAVQIESGGESPVPIVGVKKRVVKAQTQKGAEKAPQLKVQKVRVSPFHKKSGPTPDFSELADSAPKFDEVREHLPSAADLVDATARRPVRANRTKEVSYKEVQLLSSDSDVGGPSSDAEASSDYEE